MKLRVTDLPRPADEVDLSSATTARRTGRARWDPDEMGVLDLPFDRELTADEEAAVLLLLQSPTEEAADLVGATEVFVGKANPSAVETAAQVKVLSRLMLELRNRPSGPQA